MGKCHYTDYQKAGAGLKSLYAIIITLFLCAMIPRIVDILKYGSCTGRTEAVVIGLKAEKREVKGISHLEFKVYYTYDIDGDVYKGESVWMSNTPKLETGQKLTVRFDTENPSDSILEIDRNNSAGILLGYIICGIVAFIIWLWAKHR